MPERTLSDILADAREWNTMGDGSGDDDGRAAELLSELVAAVDFDDDLTRTQRAPLQDFYSARTLNKPFVELVAALDFDEDDLADAREHAAMIEEATGDDFTPYGDLTRTQREALQDLKSRRSHANRPARYGGIYSGRTLNKLVAAGWCRWVVRDNARFVELVRDVP